jgi:hypothetical protein
MAAANEVVAQKPVIRERVAVITNREINKATDSICRFYNRTAPNGSLHAFVVQEQNGKTICRSESDLRALLNNLYLKGNCLVFVHGDSKTFEQAALRGLEISRLYDINVLVYAWPSRPAGESSFKNFETSKQNAEQGTEHFQKLLLMLQEIKSTCQEKNRHLSLFAHSLGNYYVKQTFQSHLPEALSDSLFDNVILNAAATDSYGHAGWAEKIRIQKRLYIIGNRYDFNLQGVRFILLGGTQLGQRFSRPYAQNAEYIDFSRAAGLKFYPRSTHSYFFGRVSQEVPEVKSVYENLFHGKQIDFSDSRLFKKKRNKPVYWLIKQ